MSSHILNITVVGTNPLSMGILRALSDADPSLKPHARDRSHPSHPSNYTVTVLTRTNQSSPHIHNVHHQTSDYKLASLTTAFQNQHVIISTYAPADTHFQKLLIDAAIAAHVPSFVLCEFSYDTQSAKICDAFPPCAARAEVLSYLRETGQENEDFQWTGIATGCLLENGLVDGVLGFDLVWKSATIYGDGEEEFPCSTVDGIGRAVLDVLEGLEGGKYAREYLYRSELVTSQNEILVMLEKVGKWDVGRAEIEECVREGERRMEKGFFDGAMILLERYVLFGGVGELKHWGEKGENFELGRVVKGVFEGLERNGKADCGCG